MRPTPAPGSPSDARRAAGPMWAAGLLLLLAAACLDRRTVTLGQQDPVPPPFTADVTFGQSGRVVLDPGGVANLDWSPQGLDLQPDGRILVGGSAGTPSNRDLAAIRLNEDGSPDPSFGAGGMAVVDLGTDDLFESIRVQPDGKIVLAGSSGDPATGGLQGGVVRLLADGSLDTSFAGVGWRHLDLMSGDDVVNGTVTLSDGRLRVCGQGSPQPGSLVDLVVYGLEADGTIDTGFGTGGKVVIDFQGGDEFGVCEAGGGDRLLAFGMSYASETYFDFAVARILPDGSYDPAFSDGAGGPAGRVRVDFSGQLDDCQAIALQADGRILCAGTTEVDEGYPVQGAMARFLPDGTLDPSFGAGGRVRVDLGGDGTLRSVLLLPDGRIACGGSATSSRGDKDFALAVLEPDGALDAAVGQGGLLLFDVASAQDDEVTTLKLDGHGRLLLYGWTAGTTGTDIALMRIAL